MVSSYYCEHCGLKLENSLNYCTACGSRIVDRRKKFNFGLLVGNVNTARIAMVFVIFGLLSIINKSLNVYSTLLGKNYDWLIVLKSHILPILLNFNNILMIGGLIAINILLEKNFNNAYEVEGVFDQIKKKVRFRMFFLLASSILMFIVGFSFLSAVLKFYTEYRHLAGFSSSIYLFISALFTISIVSLFVSLRLSCLRKNLQDNLYEIQMYIPLKMLSIGETQ